LLRLNAKARLGSRACLDFFVSSILPNWVKLLCQLFLTFFSFVLMGLACFPEAWGLDSFLLGFLEVGGRKGLKAKAIGRVVSAFGLHSGPSTLLEAERWRLSARLCSQG
jgi:hypothetical protein